MSIHVTTKYTDTNVDLVFGRYGDGSVAIQAMNADDGMMEFTATVALDRVPDPGNVFIKNWSENEGVYQALLVTGVIGPVIRRVPSGFVEALECPLLIEANPE